MTAARPPVPSSDPRHAAVWRALADVLAVSGPVGEGLTVVDAGGGSGGFAVPLAQRGHRVTVVDPSQDALAALARRATDAGVADRVTGRQGDLAELASAAGPAVAAAGGADLLLCHAVLDQVEAPEQALAAAVRVLRPGGWLSLLVAGRPGAVLARALAGRFGEAARILTDPMGEPGPGEPTRRFDTAEAMSLVRAAGAEVVAVHGVRVFADLAAPPPPARGEGEREPPAAWADQLADLEAAVSARSPYRDLAAQLHVLARRAPAAP
ncbi:methyltransferase domain-containing protein [Pseudofrankia asymbiotica]|uniref:SAM-dependent methyltransferase n=1 Tax=Pseudofrankia asymbiotica TaxID=1834516 RepID=A0A1V2IBA8_9ACTN|nr:methyltransferase domain-containing protein [Pseudofrankia asymbiotica]ONH30498.1 SAM-dependent methyltransferase [Pseudofrankia asymbiotica]